jgi:hypothetical protein
MNNYGFFSFTDFKLQFRSFRIGIQIQNCQVSISTLLRGKGRGEEWKVEEGKEDVRKGENKKNV